MPVIPHVRDKIGKHLSYPLKFVEAASVIGPACDHLSLEVWFFAYRAPRPHEERESFRVLEAAYDVWQGEPRHRLTISPVPRVLRASVHTLLVPGELERVRDWLLAPRSPQWRSTFHAFRVSFSPTEHSLTRHEHDAA